MPVALRTRTWSSTGASGLSSRLLLLSSHPFSPACLGAGAIPVTESGTDRPDLCKSRPPLGDLTLGQACRQPITEQRSGPFTRQYRCREAPLPCSQCEKGNGSELPVSRNWPGTLGLRLNSRLTWRPDARDGAAAILILVFGQQAENIARLTWNDVTITEALVTFQLGAIQIALPDPLGTLPLSLPVLRISRL
jgi:hypothetical protein